MDYDYLPASDGTGDAALMHVTADRSIGDTTLHVDTLSKLNTKFIATSGTLLSSGLLDPSTITNFKGHIDGSNIAIDGYEAGSSDIGHTTGQAIIIKPNTGWANRVAKFIKNATGSGTPESAIFDQLTVNTSATLPALSIGTTQLAFGAATEDKWRNRVAFYARKNSDSSIGAATFTKLFCGNVDWDISNNYDESTSKFIAPYDGIYHFDAVIAIPNDTTRAIPSLYVNGTEKRRGVNGIWSSSLNRVDVSADIKLSASDYVEFYGWRQTAGVISSESGAAIGTGWGGHLVTRTD